MPRYADPSRPPRSDSRYVAFVSKLAAAILLPLTLVSGCGGGGSGSAAAKPSLARVLVEVNLGGDHVQTGTILLKPDESKGSKGLQAFGSFDSNGVAELSTFETNDGAIVGFHKVGITAFDPKPVKVEPVDPLSRTRGDFNPGSAPAPKPAPDDTPAPAPPATAEQGAPDASPPETFTDLSGTTWKYIVPSKFRDPETSGIVVEVVPGMNRIVLDLKADGSYATSQAPRP